MLKNAIEQIDLLKLDFEGAEYDIAEGSLKTVQQIVGEYHQIEKQTVENLKEAFIKQGSVFKQWTGTPASKSGIFWGINKQAK